MENYSTQKTKEYLESLIFILKLFKIRKHHHLYIIKFKKLVTSEGHQDLVEPECNSEHELGKMCLSNIVGYFSPEIPGQNC